MRRLCMRGLVLASLVLLILVGIVRLGSWPPWWWLEALDTFALYAFVPFVGTAVLAWRRRSWAFAVISIGAALLFAQQFGAPVLSTLSLSGSVAASAAPTTPQVRVLTLNLHFSSVELDALVELPRTWRPDVVMLQEVTPGFAEAGRELGHTFPAAVPARRGSLWPASSLLLIRIDDIVTSREPRSRGAWTQQVRGSDHLAVIADLEPTGGRWVAGWRRCDEGVLAWMIGPGCR